MSIKIIQERFDAYQCSSQQEEENALREISQEIALAALSRGDFFKKAVFHEGTCLRIFYSLERFSEDLDFVCLDDVSDEFMNFVKKEMKTLDLAFTEISDLEKKDESFKFKAKYAMFNGRPGSVKVDLSLRGDVVMEHQTRTILHFYDTFPQEFRIPTLNLEEIMAEKIRALIYTKHPRHLYDIWYLNGQNIPINPVMVRNKIKSVYDVDFDLELLTKRLPEKEKDWKNDLSHLLPIDPPSFAKVSNEVLEIVTDAMK